MTAPSQPIQSGNASQAANASSGNRRSSESAPAGLENLFARIAADIDTPETAAAPPVIENESVIDPTIAVDTLPPVSEETGTVESLPLIVSDTVTEDGLEPDTTENSIDTNTENRGVQHAISVLEGIQQARIAKTELSSASARPDPLVNALRVLQTAGKPEGLPGNAAEPAQLNHAQLSNHPNKETLIPTQALNRSPALTEQIQQAIQRTNDGLIIKPEFQAPETAAANNQNTVISQLGASTQTLLRTDGSTVVKMDIPGNIQQPAWQQALAERVVFAAGQNIRQAEIQLHPAELGPISVRIEAAQDRAAVQFTALHADTREALDAAMPKLRELFTQQGMDLVRADVQQNHSNNQDSQDWQSGLIAEPETESIVSENAETIPGPINRSVNPDGIVDLYA